MHIKTAALCGGFAVFGGFYDGIEGISVPCSVHAKAKRRFCMSGEKHNYPDMTSTFPFTDTTGLMQTPPRDDDELEAYQELAGMEIPKE